MDTTSTWVRRDVGVLRAGCAALLMLLAVPLLMGCDARVKEVKDAMEKLKQTVDAGDGATTPTLYSSATIDHYGELVKVAREGTREQVAKYPINDRSIILLLRHRLKPAEMRGLDGKATIKLMVDRGWWSVDSGEEEYGSVKVSGTTAWMEVKGPDERRFGRRNRFGGSTFEPDKRRTYQVRFYNEDGVWKLDETSLYDLWNESMLKLCKELGCTQERLLWDIEEEASGQEIPTSIWDTPRR